MSRLPGPKEALLNGIPLSEVQRREKRGQIVEYPGQRGIARPTGKAAPPIGKTDMLLTKAQPGRGELPPMAQRKLLWQQADAAGEPKGSRLWRAYRDAIDGQLAKSPWMRGSSLNMSIVLILGLGVWLPVWLFFKFLALFFLAVPSLHAGVSLLGTLFPIGAVLYFAVRKLRGTGS